SGHMDNQDREQIQGLLGAIRNQRQEVENERTKSFAALKKAEETLRANIRAMGLTSELSAQSMRPGRVTLDLAGTDFLLSFDVNEAGGIDTSRARGGLPTLIATRKVEDFPKLLAMDVINFLQWVQDESPQVR